MASGQVWVSLIAFVCVSVRLVSLPSALHASCVLITGIERCVIQASAHGFRSWPEARSKALIRSLH